MQIEIKENEVIVSGITVDAEGAVTTLEEDTEVNEALNNLGPGKFTFIFRKESD